MAALAAEPTLEELALKVPAYDLARSYFHSKMMIERLLPAARAGATIVTPGGEINQENAGEYEREYHERLSAYAEVITHRGYKDLSGSYQSRTTKSCGRIQSHWVGLIHEDSASGIEIRQDGFEAQLIVKIKSGGKEFSVENPAIIVEAAIFVLDAMNSEYGFRGKVKGEAILLKPDVSVLKTWPGWAGPPRKKDLKKCTITLEPLKSNPGGDARDEQELLVAALAGDLSQVGALLEQGSDVNYQNGGVTALYAASENGHEGVVQALLAKGARVNFQGRNGRTALMLASESGHEGIVQALLAQGAQVDLQAKNGRTALMLVSESGHEWIVQVLLAKGANVDLQSRYGRTALMLASGEGHAGVVQALLASGALTDIQSLVGTALYAASANGYEEIVQALLANGAQVSLQSKTSSTTALMGASGNGHEGIVQILLAKGAQVDHQNEVGLTALMRAAQSGHEEVVRALLVNGAQVDLLSEVIDTTALLSASVNGHEGVVKTLLAHNAWIDLQNKGGWTALMRASGNGHEGIVRALLANGARVDFQSKKVGWTALMRASGNGHEGIVRALLAEGARVDLQNKDGETAIRVAKTRRIKELLEAASGTE